MPCAVRASGNLAEERRAHGLPASSSTLATVWSKAYFISQGEPVNCWQWIDDILALVNLPPVRKIDVATDRRTHRSRLRNSLRMLRIKAEPPMTRFLAAQLSTSHWFDISAAERDFGYRAAGLDRRGDAAIGRVAAARNGAS